MARPQRRLAVVSSTNLTETSRKDTIMNTSLTTSKLALIDLDGVVFDATARFARAEEIRVIHLTELGDKEANDRYWREALNPAYTHLDTLIEGADEHLASLRREGFRIIYLSSRPESMRDATLKWLLEHHLFDDLNLLVLKHLQPRAYKRLADIFDPAHGADDPDDPFFPD